MSLESFITMLDLIRLGWNKSPNALPSELELVKVGDITKIDCFDHFSGCLSYVCDQYATYSGFRALFTHRNCSYITLLWSRYQFVVTGLKKVGTFWIFLSRSTFDIGRVPPSCRYLRIWDPDFSTLEDWTPRINNFILVSRCTPKIPYSLAV